MDFVVVGCRGLLATVFLVSSVSKLRSRSARDAYVVSVRGLRLLPERFADPAAAAVMAAEAACFVLLATPLSMATQVGFGLASALLAVFTIAVAMTVRRGLDTPCRCFGVTETPLGWRHVARNAVLTVAALAGLLSAAVGRLSHVGFPVGLPAAAAAVGLAAGVAVAVVVIVADDLVELFRRPVVAPPTGDVRG